MSNEKEWVVNRAIEFTRRYRPIKIDRDGNIIDSPPSWKSVNNYDEKFLKELCWAIQNYIYGEKNNESETLEDRG